MKQRISPNETVTLSEAEGYKTVIQNFLLSKIKESLNRYFTINGKIIYGKNLEHATQRYNKHFKFTR